MSRQYGTTKRTDEVLHTGQTVNKQNLHSPAQENAKWPTSFRHGGAYNFTTQEVKLKILAAVD